MDGRGGVRIRDRTAAGDRHDPAPELGSGPRRRSRPGRRAARRVRRPVRGLRRPVPPTRAQARRRRRVRAPREPGRVRAGPVAGLVDRGRAHRACRGRAGRPDARRHPARRPGGAARAQQLPVLRRPGDPRDARRPAAGARLPARPADPGGRTAAGGGRRRRGHTRPGRPLARVRRRLRGALRAPGVAGPDAGHARLPARHRQPRVRCARSRPGPRGSAVRGRWPGGVRSWSNIADSRDVVALVKDLRDAFGPDVDGWLVDNGAHAHAVAPYLTAAETGAAIAAGLDP